jgi:hypothetical protein
MSQSKRFELCFWQSNLQVLNLVAPSQRKKQAEMFPHLTMNKGVWREEESSVPKRLIHTRIRAFDTKSYFLCRLLVKRNAFGFINQRNFVFLDLDNGSEHGLKSKTVQEACKATQELVGLSFRVRETLRT